jgi:hypothetical protein
MPFIPLTKDELKHEIGLYISGKSEHMNIGLWDVTHITNMDGLFKDNQTFNGDISTWTVTQVTSMMGMFSNARAFNKPLQWDVSNVTDMSYMFSNALAFNKPLQWDVHRVTNMSYMFKGAGRFNSPLSRPLVMGVGGWDVGGVLNMASMFWDAYEFNQDISNWDVANVAISNHIFYHAHINNQNRPARFRDQRLAGQANALVQVRHEGPAFGIHNMFADIDKSALYAILGLPNVPVGDFRGVVEGHLKTFLPYVPDEERPSLTAQFEVLTPCLAIVTTDRITTDTRTLINTALEYVSRQPDFFKRKYITSFVVDNITAHGVFDPTSPQNNLSCSPGVVERIVTSIGPAGVDARSEGISTELVDQYNTLIKIVSPVSVEQIGTFAGKCSKENPSIDTVTDKDERVRLYRECIRNKLIEQGSITEGSHDPVVLTNYLVGIRNMIGGKRKTIKRLKRTRKSTRMNLKRKTKCKKKNLSNFM